MGPHAFYHSNPAGKPANYGPNSEPQNELHQFHFFSFLELPNILPGGFK
jgi:hypothetical protein